MNIGIVEKYNGVFGCIKVNNKLIDFNKKDISLKQDIKVGDTVGFRVEYRFPNIYIARNITLLK